MFVAPTYRQTARLRPALAALSLAAILSACTSLPAPDTSATPYPTHIRNVVERFELRGRLSATDGQQSASGRVEWIHPKRDQHQWTLYSPTGQIVAQLNSSADGAQLRTGDGQIHHAASIDDMLPQLLGVQVPVAGLIHWVQASARPQARILNQDARGRPGRISDAGWIIDYPAYADDSPTAAPRRIDASWGSTQIRLVIDQWTPNP